MAEYLIFFNQQWVGDHDEQWFMGRVEPSTAVVNDMAEAGVLLFAGTAQLTDTVDISILGGTLSLPPHTLLVTGMVVMGALLGLRGRGRRPRG